MVTTCAVLGCKNTIKKNKVSLFRFPKNAVYCKAWLNFCNKNINTHTARICSAHFRPERFKPVRKSSTKFPAKRLNKPRNKMKKLLPNSIPTECLPSTIQEINSNPNIIPRTIEVYQNEDTQNTVIIKNELHEMENSVSLPNCDTEIKEEHADSLEQLLDFKNRMIEKLKEELEESERKRKEESDALLEKLFKAIKDEADWKRQCHVYKTRMEHAENKLNFIHNQKEELFEKMQRIFS